MKIQKKKLSEPSKCTWILVAGAKTNRRPAHIINVSIHPAVRWTWWIRYIDKHSIMLYMCDVCVHFPCGYVNFVSFSRKCTYKGLSECFLHCARSLMLLGRCLENRMFIMSCELWMLTCVYVVCIVWWCENFERSSFCTYLWQKYKVIFKTSLCAIFRLFFF